MEKIPVVNNNQPKADTNAAIKSMILADKATKKTLKGMLSYGGIIVGAFILIVVMVIMTTDVTFESVWDFATLGIRFFVIIFATFGMYYSLSDTGMRQGMIQPDYLDTNAKYDKLKQYIVDKNYQSRSSEFCQYYVIANQVSVRTSILASVGIGYELYSRDYIGKNKKELKGYNGLTKDQIKAIQHANAYTGFKLQPKMLFQRGRMSKGNRPLGVDPHDKKTWTYAVKFAQICGSSVFVSFLAIDVIENPTWATFAKALFQTFFVAMNGFYGYKMGYENIVVDTVNYTSDQCDLMQEMIKYIEVQDTPQKEEK